MCCCFFSSCFFFIAPPTTEIYTLSLHDALPILDRRARADRRQRGAPVVPRVRAAARTRGTTGRSEEHTSELQSLRHLVCRLLLEKKKKKKKDKQDYKQKKYNT